MARKSRRYNNNQSETPIQTTEKKTEVLPTAIYARLSDKNSGKDDDGAAIENQIEVCKEYIKGTPDLKLKRVFMDNGWTGTNLNRPAFEEMMDAVRTGEIKAVVVRDLSRLGRNYLDTDGLLETIFPSFDVRFISVKERFDTYNFDWNSDSLKIELQNLINDLYARDISKKIHAAYKVQKENKTFSWRSIPYGYMRNEDHTGIVPDSETSETVKLMFKLRLEGFGAYEIANILNKEGYRTASTINGKFKKWSGAVVDGILANPAYIGNQVWGRCKKELFRGGKKIKTPESEWAVKENSHEPLVSKEVFNKVQEFKRLSREKYIEAREKNSNVTEKCLDKLKGKVFCGDCGRRMAHCTYVRKNAKNEKHRFGYYTTNNGLQNSGCELHSISQIKMEKAIMNVIRSHMKIAVDYDELLRKLKSENKGKNKEKELEKRIKSIQGKIDSVQSRKLSLYKDYSEQIISYEDYTIGKEKYDSEKERLSNELDLAVNEMNECRNAIPDENKWISMLRNIEESDELTQGLADSTIDKVLVYKGGTVEIHLKYEDIYKETGELIERAKEG